MPPFVVPRRLALAGTAAAAALPVAADAAPLLVNEYRATKTRNGQTITLAMYRKRLASRTAQPVLFLVHGSSISALPSFDLAIPGHGEFSAMNVFARVGFDVWTMDHEGYGKSSRTDGNSDIASGVDDLRAGVALIARETKVSRCHFLGESSGALRACAFAMAEPDRVGRLLLAAMTYTGKGSPTLSKRAEQVEYFRTHNRRTRDRAMIASIFTRDKPGTTDPAVAEALVKAELPFGDTVPTGTYLDMTANLPVVDPRKVLSPVCILRGEYDGIATDEDLWDFYRQLPNGDRQYSIIAGTAHALGTSRARNAFWHVAQAFLTIPPPPG